MIRLMAIYVLRRLALTNAIKIFSSFEIRKATWLLAVIPIVLVSCSSTACQDGAVGGGSDNPRHVVIVLDKSASMEYLVNDVLSGFNNLVDQLPDSSFVTLFGFESIYGLEMIFNHERANAVRELTINDYQLGDGTPLYDAISGAIAQVKTNSVNRTDEKILFVIISDGLENSSTKYDLSDTRNSIQRQIDNGWDLRFYGLGADAASEATSLGIPLTDGSSFAPSQAGVDDVFDDIAGSFTQSRTKPKCVRAIP